MFAEICCISTLLMSLSITDLKQTATFTSMGYQELNPIAAPIVESKSPRGEIALGALSVYMQLYLEKNVRREYKIPIQLLWSASHTLAVYHNNNNGFKELNIILPVITIGW